MSETSLSYEASDIRLQRWVIRAAPEALRPYLVLMRLDRPNGAWLGLTPSWWSIALASSGVWPDVKMLVLFALGAVVMRGAGCVVNDIVDRDFDAQVARTKTRPLPCGLVSVKQARAFAVALGGLGLFILLQFNTFAIFVGAVSVLTLVIYPYMKRFTYWPQFFLGLAINWGALLGWAAVRGDLNLAPGLLYLGGIFWTLGWDTIYGHQDKEDDARLGLKSGALRFGLATPKWLMTFYAAALTLIAAAGWQAGLSVYFYPALLPAALHLIWQVATLDMDNPKNCLARFSSNRDFGLLVFAAIVIGQVL
ncbi:4-hydroxybenzoate octaprenyltransferase [Pseudomonadota bacterium]